MSKGGRFGFTFGLVVLAVAALAAAHGCAGKHPAPATGPTGASGAPAPALSEAEIGLVPGPIEAVPEPPPVPPDPPEPGDRGPLPRAFPGEPPLVPHTVAEFLPITRDENLCLECHDRAVAEDAGATPAPEDHYVDLRRQPEALRDTAAGARFVCVSCHVEAHDAQPLRRVRSAGL